MTEDPNPDKIFVRDHFTDFEKLLFARAEIKDLKKENSELQIELGKANSEITELKYIISQSKEIADFNSIKMANNTLRKNNKNLTDENRRIRDELFNLKRK